MIRNKKGQIGTTLVWPVAFTIIFFIIILFTSSAALLSSARYSPVLSFFFSGGNSATLVSGESTYAVSQTLSVFLDRRIESEYGRVQIRDYLSNPSFNKELIANEANSIFSLLKVNENNVGWEIVVVDSNKKETFISGEQGICDFDKVAVSKRVLGTNEIIACFISEEDR